MRSLAMRIFLLVGGAVLLTGAVTTAIAAIATRGHLEELSTRNFQRQADALATTVASGGPPESSIFYLSESGLMALPRHGRLSVPLESIRDRVRAELRTRQPATSVDTPAGEILLAVRDTPEGQVVLARDASLRQRDWRPLWLGLFTPALAGVAIAAATALLLARRLVKPLRELSAASARVAGGDHAARVPVRGRDELARLGASFNTMAAEVAEAQDRERELILAVSHDFRTPLTSVRGYAEALDEGAVEPKLAAEAIGEEARRLDRLVCDLLDLGRSQQGTLSFDLRPVDLGALARDLVARFSRMASELDLTLQANSGAGGWVLADHDRLMQVASNLIENGMHATPAGGLVTVTALDHRLEVSDTGPGLSAEDQAHAFERYFLHRRHFQQREVGAGLGLAIVKQLTEQMRGRVWLESEPGKGAKFIVELPAAPAPAHAETPTGSAN